MAIEQPRYDIYFTGKLVDGVNTDQAKMGLAQVFNTSVLKVNKLFNGKPQLIKRNVDKTEALKYKAALHQAGLLVAVKAHQATTEQTTTKQLPEQSSNPSSPPPLQPNSALSLAPAGEDVLSESERTHFEPANIDTSAIKLASPFLDETANVTPQPPAPDTSHISIAEVGADLNTEPEYPLPPLPLDLDNYSLAPAGEPIETLVNEAIPLDPDTSTLSLGAAGEDLLPNAKEKTTPPAPDTSHISLETNSQ